MRWTSPFQALQVRRATGYRGRRGWSWRRGDVPGAVLLLAMGLAGDRHEPLQRVAVEQHRAVLLHAARFHGLAQRQRLEVQQVELQRVLARAHEERSRVSSLSTRFTWLQWWSSMAFRL